MDVYPSTKLVLCVFFVACLCVGCGGQKPATDSSGSVDPKQFSIQAPQGKVNPETVTASDSTPVADSPGEGEQASSQEKLLAVAYKAYKESYEEYVRLLRESGPQTVETLHALVGYQQKYRIYQLLLNATKKR